jgi:hypothetical protein
MKFRVFRESHPGVYTEIGEVTGDDREVLERALGPGRYRFDEIEQAVEPQAPVQEAPKKTRRSKAAE